MKLDQQAEMFCGTCKTKRIFNFGRLNCDVIATQCLTCKTTNKIDPNKFCCKDMSDEIGNDEIVEHDPISGEFAIRYPDGSNINTIKHCPWCGTKLPAVVEITYLPEEVSDVVAGGATAVFDRTDCAIIIIALALAIIFLVCYIIL
jgi:hypothetical protein